jgi:predicted urease superfamily metal-dependent hydrolase
LIFQIKEYAETQQPITLKVGLTYFNTASSRNILDLLEALKEYEENGGSVTVNWSVQDWDEDMQQEVEDFALDADLTINIIEIASENTPG